MAALLALPVMSPCRLSPWLTHCGGLCGPRLLPPSQDYLKVDFCGATPGPTNLSSGHVSYQPGPQYDAWMALGKELNATGRPIYYSICPHRAVKPADGLPAEWAGDDAYSPPPEWSKAERYALANSILVEYTNTWDSWYSRARTARQRRTHQPWRHGGIITDIDSMLQLTNLSYSGPGSWNDADMLQLCTYGKGMTPHSPGGMTLSEYRAHYSVWAILASPLIISADVRTLKEQHPECLALMLNAEIVAVNQDPAALPPRLVSQRTNTTNSTAIVSSSDVVSQVFARPLAGEQLAVVLLNRGEAPAQLSVSWAELGLAAGAKMHVRDVTNQKDLPTASDTWGATVGKHDVAFIRLSPSS